MAVCMADSGHCILCCDGSFRGKNKFLNFVSSVLPYSKAAGFHSNQAEVMLDSTCLISLSRQSAMKCASCLAGIKACSMQLFGNNIIETPVVKHLTLCYKCTI